MLNILGITIEPPGNAGGGALGIKQTLMTLQKIGRVDYICPYNNDESLKECNNVKFFQFCNNIILRIYYLFCRGATSAYCASWGKIYKTIKWENYDIVSIDKTQEGYILNDIRRKGKTAIVRAHNVEYDYYKNIYRLDNTIKNYVRYKLAYINEKYVINNADAVICLSQKDCERFKELYACPSQKLFINPVCLGQILDDFREEYIDLPSKYFLITGSLWYGANCEGIIWFINKVWKRFSLDERCGYSLVLAGSRPSKKLKKIVNELDDVYIVDSPKRMTKIFQNAYIYIAPILSGAGMKVKVAEALSYGLNIFATEHALQGYDIDEGLWCLKNEEDFISAMKKAFNAELSLIDKKLLLDHFKEKYSLEKSMQNYSEIIQKMRINYDKG